MYMSLNNKISSYNKEQFTILKKELCLYDINLCGLCYLIHMILCYFFQL